MPLQQVKLCYRNILESGTVAVTSENTSFPAYRLFNRETGRLFKGNSTPAHFYITVDQGASLIYPVNRLLIPAGHNLNGLALKVQYSDDNFVTPVDAVSWTQPDTGLIDKSFAQQTKRYLRLDIASPSAAPQLSEMFLTYAYTFLANPVLRSKQASRRNNEYGETRSGLDRDVKHGEGRRWRSYNFVQMPDAQRIEFETWESVCEGIKACFVDDHLGNVIFMKLLNEPEFSLDLDSDGLLWSCQIDLREVLGATV